MGGQLSFPDFEYRTIRLKIVVATDSANFKVEFVRGKTYSGVGDGKRMNQSAKDKATKYNDPVVKQEYAGAPNKRKALLQEHEDITSNGRGLKYLLNYDVNNSAGKKMSENHQN